MPTGGRTAVRIPLGRPAGAKNSVVTLPKAPKFDKIGRFARFSRPTSAAQIGGRRKTIPPIFTDAQAQWPCDCRPRALKPQRI